MMWMSILKQNRNNPKSAKTQQPTDNKNNTKYQNVSQRWPSFHI